MLDVAINGGVAIAFRSPLVKLRLSTSRTTAFLSWIGIKDIGRRDIGVQPRIVPIRRPGPERGPGGPTEDPIPSRIPNPNRSNPQPQFQPGQPKPQPPRQTEPSPQ